MGLTNINIQLINIIYLIGFKASNLGDAAKRLNASFKNR